MVTDTELQKGKEMLYRVVSCHHCDIPGSIAATESADLVLCDECLSDYEASQAAAPAPATVWQNVYEFLNHTAESIVSNLIPGSIVNNKNDPNNLK